MDKSENRFDGMWGREIKAQTKDTSPYTTPQGWSKEANQFEFGKLRRSLVFDNYVDATGLVTKVAMLAEKRKHHPDISFGYQPSLNGYEVLIELTRKSAGGVLTLADYRLAEAINELPEVLVQTVLAKIDETIARTEEVIAEQKRAAREGRD